MIKLQTNLYKETIDISFLGDRVTTKDLAMKINLSIRL
jgi:hypothetical protein